jgi:mxaJ protein
MTRVALLSLVVAGVCSVLVWRLADGAAQRVGSGATLRVCSDPNNLPFSNSRREGFENRLADLLARDLGARVEYTWWAQRRGFLRNTLNAGLCDVVMGYPEGADMVATTAAYYRSTYVFVTRRDRELRIASFDDPRLRDLRVGVQLVGDDGANTPPAHALSRRGVVANVVGYSVYGDYRTDSPPSAIVAAVARGDVDVAAVWGPLAGYFAALQRVPLDLIPVSPPLDDQLPQTFEIAMAVRVDDRARLERLNRFLRERRSEISRILATYHVPLAGRSPATVYAGFSGVVPGGAPASGITGLEQR